MRTIAASVLAPVALALVALLGACGGGPAQPVAGGDAAAAAPIQPDQISWAAFTEPSENAFTAQAPQGWRVNAGVVRESPSDATPWLTAASPDQTTLLYIGDPDIPALFITPGYAQGAPEGQQVQGAVAPYTVLDIRTAAQFAQMYGASNLPGQCASQQLVGAQARPDLVQLAAGRPGNQGLQIDAGQAGFSCVVNGKTYEADVYAITFQYPNGLWNAQVFGLRTPQGQGAAAEKLLFQMLASKQASPQWAAQMAQAAQQAGAASRAQIANSWNQFGQQMNAEQQQLAATLQSGHEAYMTSMSQAADASSAAFVQQQYNKGVANQNFLLMVRNQHLVAGPNGLVAVPN